MLFINVVFMQPVQWYMYVFLTDIHSKTKRGQFAKQNTKLEYEGLLAESANVKK